MEKLSNKLGLRGGCLIHYCPACEGIHKIPVFGDYPIIWTMNGTVNIPGVSPSIKITSSKEVDGKMVEFTKCHYTLEKGLLNYCNDTTHKYTNQVIPLPDIPEQYWPKRGN